MSPEVAAFDVDGTLTVRDCVFPFLVSVAGPTGLAVGLARRLPDVLRAAVRRDRNRLKEILVAAALSGRPVEEVNLLGESFAAKVAAGWIREDVASRLRWHQDQGHVVVLVSASLAPYLHPLGDLLEVDAVLCTELDEADGSYTGRLLGVNCRSGEKVERLRSWAADAGIEGADWLQHAYGDSSGDSAMIAAAVHGVNVSRQEVPV